MPLAVTPSWLLSVVLVADAPFFAAGYAAGTSLPSLPYELICHKTQVFSCVTPGSYRLL
jgi:hypothetical protein